MTILATQRPFTVRLTLADGRSVNLGPFVTFGSAAAAARSWEGGVWQRAPVVEALVVVESAR